MFLINSREGSFAATLSFDRAGLIPKVRPLFCRVPERVLARSPEDSLLIHQSRFAVRIPFNINNEVFLGTLDQINFPCGIFPNFQARSNCLEQTFRIYLESRPTNSGTEIVRSCSFYHDASLTRIIKR